MSPDVRLLDPGVSTLAVIRVDSKTVRAALSDRDQRRGVR